MTLYIIGNGFDLAHGLHTSYEDFHKWLIEHGNRQFVDMFESMYPNVKVDGLWCDIESALGQTTVDQIMEYAKGYTVCQEMQTIPVDNIQVVTTGIQGFINKWARQIDTSSVKPCYNIGTDAQFLTFNYTLTLEDVYGIPSENILHIHKSVKREDDLIIGYKSPTESQRHIYPIENGDEAELRRVAKMEYDRYIKHPTYNISQNERFFLSLKEIKKIVVLGHSCSEVDWPYLQKVAEICPSAKWIFGYYNKDSKRSLLDKVKRFLPKGIKFKFYMNRFLVNDKHSK